MPPRKAHLEELLVDEAARIIESEGVEALSLRELGRRVGVSRAAPYHYFPDKAALVARVGAAGFERLSGRIADAADAHADPIARLRAGLRAYVAFARDEGHFFHLMFSGALTRHPDAASADDLPFAFSSPSAREGFGVLVRGIADAQSVGLLLPGDPLLRVNVFWAYAHGVAVLARGDHLKHPAGADAVFDAGFDALLAAYRVTPPRAP